MGMIQAWIQVSTYFRQPCDPFKKAPSLLPHCSLWRGNVGCGEKVISTLPLRQRLRQPISRLTKIRSEGCFACRGQRWCPRRGLKKLHVPKNQCRGVWRGKGESLPPPSPRLDPPLAQWACSLKLLTLKIDEISWDVFLSRYTKFVISCFMCTCCLYCWHTKHLIAARIAFNSVSGSAGS